MLTSNLYTHEFLFHSALLCIFSHSEAFKDLVVVKYSEQGSSIYPFEQQAWVHFIDFLDECAGT